MAGMAEQGCNSDGEVYGGFYVPHQKVDLDCQASDDGKTRQEFAEECDINNLLARYEKTGVINHFNLNDPQYLDLSDGVPDLATALQLVSDAQVAFMTLPAVTRREFDNDPLKFVAFAEDPANLEKMREWKLAPPAPAEPPPVKVEFVGNPPPIPSSDPSKP